MCPEQVEPSVEDLSLAERLARAVLLFHSATDWTPELRAQWRHLTDGDEATTKTLCDLARRVRADQKRTPSAERVEAAAKAIARQMGGEHGADENMRHPVSGQLLWQALLPHARAALIAGQG